MERTDRAVVLPGRFDWTDVGSWSALWAVEERDDGGNTFLGNVLSENARNSYLRSEGPIVAAIGVEDLIVVATSDAVLIAHRERDQDVKKIVDRLRVAGSEGPL
jgi:mannose-1-phosphate guanylyltransferase/mannose-1-phosphate guanylyltransferase/mannose-6-phosphate isomerase